MHFEQELLTMVAVIGSEEGVESIATLEEVV